MPILTLLTATLVFSAGCARSARDVPGERIVDDALGVPVHLPGTIERVVTLAPGVTEIVAAAGGVTQLVGVSTADDFPDKVRTLPRVSALPVNFEAVAALNPDVVFAAVQVNDVRDRSVFDELGIPTFYLPSRTLDEVFSSVLQVGELLQTQPVARDTVAALKARAASLRDRTRDMTRPRVLFLISIDQLHSFGPESYVQDLITIAGGESITADLNVEMPILDDEFVLAHRPDIIAGTFNRPFGQEEILALHPTWGSLPAIRNNRICSVDGDLILRAGPRNVLGAEELFKCFHPNPER